MVAALLVRVLLPDPMLHLLHMGHAVGVLGIEICVVQVRAQPEMLACCYRLWELWCQVEHELLKWVITGKACPSRQRRRLELDSISSHSENFPQK